MRWPMYYFGANGIGRWPSSISRMRSQLTRAFPWLITIIAAQPASGRLNGADGAGARRRRGCGNMRGITRSEISLAEIRSTGVAGFHSKRLVTGRMNTVLGVRSAFPRHENHQRYEC